MMTNYNDGKWHIHKSEECPVGRDSIVWVSTYDGVIESRAGDITWNKDIIAFRVIKEYREPREFWIYYDMVYLCDSSARQAAKVDGCNPEKIIHVREVLK